MTVRCATKMNVRFVTKIAKIVKLFRTFVNKAFLVTDFMCLPFWLHNTAGYRSGDHFNIFHRVRYEVQCHHRVSWWRYLLYFDRIFRLSSKAVFYLIDILSVLDVVGKNNFFAMTVMLLIGLSNTNNQKASLWKAQQLLLSGQIELQSYGQLRPILSRYNPVLNYANLSFENCT